jgi:linear primary-alkylsulfatase
VTNGVLIQADDPRGGTVDLTVTLTKPQLLGLLGGMVTLDTLTTDGDVGVVQRLLSYLDPVSGDFPIVTP